MSQIFVETRMFRLSDGEEIMTVALFVLIQYRSVTDGQMDRQTDRQAGRRLDSAAVSDVVVLATKIGPAGRLRW